MATKYPWEVPATSNYTADLGRYGINSDYVTPIAPAMGPQMPEWNPQTAFPMAGNGPVAASMFSGWGDTLKDSGFLGSMDTKTGLKTEGWGGMALGAASGLAGAYMGMKNYGLAKQSLAQGKEQFERNFGAQLTTTNNRIADQYEARNSYAPGSVGSKEDYMKTRSIA